MGRFADRVESRLSELRQSEAQAGLGTQSEGGKNQRVRVNFMYRNIQAKIVLKPMVFKKNYLNK